LRFGLRIETGMTLVSDHMPFASEAAARWQ